MVGMHRGFAWPPLSFGRLKLEDVEIVAYWFVVGNVRGIEKDGSE